MTKKKKFIYHNQPFMYQYHKAKSDLFLKDYPTLKSYLNNIEKIIPKNVFKTGKRISQIAKNEFETPEATNGVPENPKDFLSTFSFSTTKKQNYATELADIALQITNNNGQRHQIVENIMLKNDTTTIATEIPVYMNNITGHIDILQIRYNKIHILDFKPGKINKQQATAQLYLYASALSKITNIPLNRFQCAFFNNKNYFEPNQNIYKYT